MTIDRKDVIEEPEQPEEQAQAEEIEAGEHEAAEDTAAAEAPESAEDPHVGEVPESAKVAAVNTAAHTGPEETGWRAFWRYYVWIPDPAGSEKPAETGWRAFWRYYVWLPDPADARAENERRNAAQAAAHTDERVQYHGTATVVGHPPYIKVFLWLIVLTIIEVTPIFTEILFNWTPIPHNIWVPILLILACIKATLVALYYMHLKYDKPWLAWALMGPLAFAVLFGGAIVAS